MGVYYRLGTMVRHYECRYDLGIDDRVLIEEAPDNAEVLLVRPFGHKQSFDDLTPEVVPWRMVKLDAVQPWRFVRSNKATHYPPDLHGQPGLGYLIRHGAADTAERRDSVARALWGPLGSQSAIYKRGGWAWDLRPVLKRIIVKSAHGQWQDYFAPNKTSLRRALGYAIDEMHYLPNGHAGDKVR